MRSPTRTSGRVRAFCLYGETTGETDEYGLPVRYPWANDYRGDAGVLYGHTRVTEVAWINNTACLVLIFPTLAGRAEKTTKHGLRRTGTHQRITAPYAH